jgi:hypothetical protein
MWDDILKRK